MRGKTRTGPALSSEAENIYGYIGYNALSLEKLAAKSGLPAKRIINALAILEMDGLIKEGPTNHYSRYY